MYKKYDVHQIEEAKQLVLSAGVTVYFYKQSTGNAEVIKFPIVIKFSFH